jgi:CheY-like chemotaxis protein
MPANVPARSLMATVLLVGVDLMVRSRLEGILSEHRLVTSDSAHQPDLVLCDIARVDADDVVESWPDVPILGFTNHVDTQGLQRAHAAGFDQVIVRSALFDRARQVVADLTGPPGERTAHDPTEP